MVLILIGAAVLSLLLGKYLEAGAIGAIVVLFLTPSAALLNLQHSHGQGPEPRPVAALLWCGHLPRNSSTSVDGDAVGGMWALTHGH